MKKFNSSLAWKLTLSFSLIAIISVVLVIVFIRLSSNDRFNNLIVDQQRNYLQVSLADYYEQNGSWDGVNDIWSTLVPPIPDYNFDNKQPRDSGYAPPSKPDSTIERFLLFGLADANGTVVVGLEHNFPVGKVLSAAEIKAGEAVEVDGTVVGTILTADMKPRLTPAENQYLTRTNQAVLMAGIAAVVIALIFGFLLARRLSQPLKELTLAAGRIADGELEQEVPVRSKDEVGKLTESFNRMSKEVAHANLLRRQMTADIAHDLRTPLTVISGYIEAMRDQVLEPSIQRLTMIYTEIEHLQKLVDDLRVLSQAEAGELRLNRQWLQPGDLLERASALFDNLAESKGITIKVDVQPDLPDVWLDEARMMQVLENLISNALRYTPIDGRITLGARREETSLIVSVHDTGSGIAPEDVPMIFQRLYRGDSSRSEEEGSAGLGLSIAKAFVEAHGGSIMVESELNHGTTMLIRFPISPE